MRFGICTSTSNAQIVKDAGWDFVEENVQKFFSGEVPDEQWSAPAPSALPVPAANMLVPKSLKITGPDANLEKLTLYMTRVISRAARYGTRILVFGSGGAREVPAGFDRERARQQIVVFAEMSAHLAAEHDVMIVVEPLNRGECNIINSIGEAMQYVRDVHHPNFQCLLDTYHFWLENDERGNAAVPFIKHVHVADKDGRVPPGESGTSDYRPLFAVLKRGSYDDMISVEAGAWTNLAEQAPRVLEFLKQQWNKA
jgi:sugar phosphate isomerase/epimerase